MLTFPIQLGTPSLRKYLLTFCTRQEQGIKAKDLRVRKETITQLWEINQKGKKLHVLK